MIKNCDNFCFLVFISIQNIFSEFLNILCHLDVSTISSQGNRMRTKNVNFYLRRLIFKLSFILYMCKNAVYDVSIYE